MAGKLNILANARLYLVLDRSVAGYDRLFDILKTAVSAGVDIVQLRDKHGDAAAIVDFSRRAMRFLAGRVPFIVNDRVDLAKYIKADGVHLGQDDLPIAFARKVLGTKAIVGVSCQNLPAAIAAQQCGADYIGFGSVYKTLTKPERQPMDLSVLSAVYRRIKVPVFAIGGIGIEQMRFLRPIGVDRVAVTRAICEAKDVAAATKRFIDVLAR